MSVQSGFEPAQESLSAVETWVRALTQPTEAGYQAIVNDPRAGYRRAVIWIFLASIAITFIGIALAFLTDSGGSLGSGGLEGQTFVWLICLAPVTAIIPLLGLAIVTGISHIIARMLGGTGTYETLFYTLAAYLSPFWLVTGLISLVPYLNCLTLPLGLYAIYLNILSVKSVHRFGWGPAIFSSTAVILALFVLGAICVVVLLATLGPAVGTVFSNIVEGITTPMP